jgi:hypothetical protein
MDANKTRTLKAMFRVYFMIVAELNLGDTNEHRMLKNLGDEIMNLFLDE